MAGPGTLVPGPAGDLVVAFLGVNVGVLAVSMVLGSSAIGAGLGLGLFGVLSIIRVRSTEISQHEVAYYSPPSPWACWPA